MAIDISGRATAAAFDSGTGGRETRAPVNAAPPIITPSTELARGWAGARSARGVSTLVVFTLLLSCKSSPPDPHAVVAEVVAASVRHESAMLTILEAHRNQPGEARAQLVAYVAAHREELDSLAHQRQLLENEPSAFAAAVQANSAHMADNLERRRRLLESSPGLMADVQIKAALARLAAL